MDSLTQAVLGGAVGTAVAGKTLGRRAALWGAVAGTLPDLDVLANPFLDTAGELLVHRGVTHGIAFALVVGPALAWLAGRLIRWRAERRGEPAPVVPWRPWTALFVAALLTHPLLDAFTVYGTQLLAPFSRRPFAMGSVFIIDPLYTVPLALFLLAALVRRQPRIAVIGLAVSTAYLGWGVAAQTVVERRARASLDAQAKLLVTPMPFQSLLWRVVVDDGDGAATYEHSLLGPAWLFEPVGRSPRADLGPAEGTRGAETLRWFSRGWLVEDVFDGIDAAPENGTAPEARSPLPLGEPGEGHSSAGGNAAHIVADARFGCGPDGRYVFRWAVAPDGSFRQLPFGARLSGEAFSTLARRALYAAPVPAAMPCPAPPARPAPTRRPPNRGDVPSFTEPVPQTTQPPAP